MSVNPTNAATSGEPVGARHARDAAGVSGPGAICARRRALEGTPVTVAPGRRDARGFARMMRSYGDVEVSCP